MGKRKKTSKSSKVVAYNKRTDSINLRIIFVALVTITLLILYILVKDNFSSVQFPSFTNFFKAAEKTDNPPIQKYTDTQLFGTPTTTLKKSIEILRKNADGKEQSIVTMEKDRINPFVFQWQNYLFISNYNFKDGNNSSGEATIKVHNLESGETKEIFKSEGREILMGSIGPVSFIGNRLYFTYTSYLSDNPIYYIDLPPNGTISTLNSQLSGVNRFITVAGMYYVAKASGDACAGQTKYAAFDPKTNYAMQPWQTSSDGCSFGEQLIGFDTNGAMIFSTREADPSDNQNSYIGTYTNITRVYPWTPDKKETMLDSSKMLKNVKHMFYSRSLNSILMIGDTINTINLQTYAQQYIAETPKDWKNAFLTITRYDGTNLCIKIGQSGYTVWNVIGNGFTNTSQKCEEESEALGTSLDIVNLYSHGNLKSLDERVASLKLPPNYEIVSH